MKTYTRIMFTLLAMLIAGFVFLGVSTQNGVEILPDLGQGEVNYFATVGGTGDCTAWNKGCTFRTAVSKCDGTKQCTIYLGAGTHDCNNVATAAGTTITQNYVHIIGFGETGEYGQSSQLVNAHATATHILQVTGNRFMINHVSFDNSAQAVGARNPIMLTLNGSYTEVMYCGFHQNVGDGGGTAISLTGGLAHTIDYNHFRNINTYAINVGAVSKVYINSNVFWKNVGTAVYVSNANADDGILRDNKYTGCGVAIDLAIAVAKVWYIINPLFTNNATNFADVASYGGTIFVEALNQATIRRQTYPTSINPATGGVLVSKDAAIDAFGAYNEIIPAATFAKPIQLQGIVFLDWSAEQTFKLELFYGSANPATVSLGVYTFVMGDPANKNKLYTPLDLSLVIPARATIGAKLASSTAGVDSVRLALEYSPL